MSRRTTNRNIGIAFSNIGGKSKGQRQLAPFSPPNLQSKTKEGVKDSTQTPSTNSRRNPNLKVQSQLFPDLKPAAKLKGQDKTSKQTTMKPQGNPKDLYKEKELEESSESDEQNNESSNKLETQSNYDKGNDSINIKEEERPTKEEQIAQQTAREEETNNEKKGNLDEAEDESGPPNKQKQLMSQHNKEESQKFDQTVEEHTHQDQQEKESLKEDGAKEESEQSHSDIEDNGTKRKQSNKAKSQDFDGIEYNDNITDSPPTKFKKVDCHSANRRECVQKQHKRERSNTPEKSNKSKHNNCYYSRITVKITIPPSDQPQDTFYTTMLEFFTELLQAEDGIIIIPWKSLSLSNIMSKNSPLPKTITGMTRYCFRTYTPKQGVPATMYPQIFIGHNTEFEDLRETMQPYLSSKLYGMYYNMLQAEDPKDIG